MQVDREYRTHLEGRMKAMWYDRNSFWTHWKELAEYILPRRYKWLITPNQANRGSPINSNIIDSTGTIAARTCASGMMSGITSPTRPWFKLRIREFDDDETGPVAIWLSDTQKRMMKVFQESNFYNCMATIFADLVVFGTSVCLIYEDYEDIIRGYNPCAGEYYLALNDRYMVDTVYREFTMTIKALGEWFGENNLPEDSKVAFKARQGESMREVAVCHAIEPNVGGLSKVPKLFPFREAYWVRGSDGDQILGERGFHEFPALCPRWDLQSNDAYGRSPGMDALGDIKQLQQETKRKAQAIDKMVNPPLMADMQLKNQPASQLPGGVTYVTGLAQNPGMKPIFQVMPPVQEIMMDITEVQNRIKTIFFNDLFQMISQLQTVRTATEIDARREEKLVLLGPVLERFQNEGLDPAIDRAFNIMLRGGLLAPPPPEIEGIKIEVEYVSMLAQAQRAVSTGGIERLLAQAGNLAAVRPDVLDNIDFDETTREYATLLDVSPKLLLPPDAVAAIREQRAEQQAQTQLAEQTLPGAKAAQTLSETEVGGGSTALDILLGNQ